MDAFRSLRLPALAVDPDPAFARALRARLEATVPGGSTPVHQVITPYLAVADARAAIDWYVFALGAVAASEPYVMPDGRIGHAELRIQGALVMIADAHPEIGHSAPTGAGSPVSLHLEVPDVDTAFRRLVPAGALAQRPPSDMDHGRGATVTDPFGHRWMLHGPRTGVPFDASDHGVRHGDVGYLSLQVPDVDRAEAFFAAVLGWDVRHHQVVGQTVAMGFGPATGAPGGHLAIAVRDVDAACEVVRARGGEAGEPREESYGRLADCRLDGWGFSLYTPAGGVSTGPGRPGNGALDGDVSYLTLQCRRSGPVREVLTEVAGWDFTPGRLDDAWQIRGVSPEGGLSGGHDVATVRPMFRVDDLDAALARVREAGGTTAAVEDHPYGRTCDCLDDQGTAFWLAQH